MTSKQYGYKQKLHMVQMQIGFNNPKLDENYHDHPKFWFCLKEDLSCFLCVQRIAGFFWQECPEVNKLINI